LIAANTLLPVLEVAISTSQVGEPSPGSAAPEADTSSKNRGSQVKFFAHQAARTAAAITALDDCHISERLRKWQEMHINKNHAQLNRK
jgi:phosphoribosylcarboxyaminoimidazole (NCAIR) mutase